MRHEAVTLGDKYDLSKNRILLTGTQAVIRLALMQHARDRRKAAGERDAETERERDQEDEEAGLEIFDRKACRGRTFGSGHG